MADIFWSYWDASVRFALLSLLLLVATPLLRRWVSPRLLCWAWALLLLRLSLPFALPFSGSIFNLSESLQPSAWTDVLRNGVVKTGWGETVLPNLRTQDEAVKASEVGFSWENALVLAWALGVAALLARLALQAIRLHRFFGRAERQNSGRLYEIFKDTRRRFGIHANVPLLVSRDVKTPGIAGIFNPRVVIPQVCAEELNDEEIRCVLLHELTHYRRGDLFLHHLLLVISFVHWYNPFVWLVFRQFKVSMEQACDADVVNTECITTIRQYGLTLLRVMERSRGAAGSPAGALCLLGNRKSSAIKNRIHLIVNPCRPAPILLAMGLALFGASFTYSITGEGEGGRKEGERLLGLTRVSSPLFSRQSEGPENYSRILSGSEDIATPSSWRQEVDVSGNRGRQATARISYRVANPGSRQDFWLHVKNANGHIIASGRDSAIGAKGGELQWIELAIGFARNAETLEYGLASTGPGGVWLESFELLPASARNELRE